MFGKVLATSKSTFFWGPWIVWVIALVVMLQVASHFDEKTRSRFSISTSDDWRHSDIISPHQAAYNRLMSGSDNNWDNIHIIKIICYSIPLILLAWIISTTIGVKRNCITVHENGISGKCCGTLFLLYGELCEIHVPLNKITTADSTKDRLVVNTSGFKYVWFIQNPSEIQKVILSQQQKISPDKTESV